MNWWCPLCLYLTYLKSVFVEVAFLSKCPVTLGADMFLVFHGVDTAMRAQVGFISKCFIAAFILALEGFLTSMYPHVSFEKP